VAYVGLTGEEGSDRLPEAPELGLLGEGRVGLDGDSLHDQDEGVRVLDTPVERCSSATLRVIQDTRDARVCLDELLRLAFLRLEYRYLSYQVCLRVRIEKGGGTPPPG